MPPNTSREFKRISLQLRSLASQALRSNNDDARVNLRRLLAFVNDTPILRVEVERAPVPAGDVMELWNRTRQERDRLAFPDDVMEELGLLHALLTEMAKPRAEDFWQLCYGYGATHDFKESIREVLHDTCGRYTAHLRGVIEMALLHSDDPAYDSRRVAVHVTGGTNQVNVAQDQARIDARQELGATAREILSLARELAAAAAIAARDSGSEEAAELEEVSTAVADVAASPKPSRFTLRAAAERLERLAGAVQAVATLAPYASKLAPFARELARRLSEWVPLIAK